MAEAMSLAEIDSRLRAAETTLAPDPARSKRCLEALRAAFSASTNLFDRQRALYAEVSAAPEGEWRRLLQGLRNEFEDRNLASTLGAVHLASSESLEAGWHAWLAALGEAIVRSKLRHAQGLCDAKFAFEPSQPERSANLKRAVRCMSQSRWEEALEEVEFLAAQSCVTTATRARLLAIAGQIETYRLDNRPRGRELIQQAQALAPEDATVVATLGDLFMAEGALDRAEDFARQAMKLAPQEAAGWVLIGERWDKAERADLSEKWFRDAIRNAGGDASGYERLLGVLGGAGRLSEREDEYAALMQTRLAMDRDGDYDVLIASGDHQLANERDAQARASYERAIALQPSWPRAYVVLARSGRSWLRPLARKALDVDPAYPGSYLFLAMMFEDQSRWQEAQDAFAAFPERPRAWASYARASVGRMLAKRGQQDLAEQQMLRALKLDPASPHAQRALEDYATEQYRNDVAGAQRIYDQLLDAVGKKTYLGTYHNLLGNLYYGRDDYRSAAAHYQKAADAAPREAVFRRNLGTVRKEPKA